MNKIIQLSAPKTIDDLRIKHHKVLTDVKFKGDVTPLQMCEFVAGITGSDLPQILIVDINDTIKMFHHCIGLFAGFKKDEAPKKVIEIQGVMYFRVDPNKVSTGWHIDLDSLPEDPDPVLLMALLYIPKGVYGQLDENGNIKFPLAERVKIFKEHFKLTDFISSVSFFLNRSKR